MILFFLILAQTTMGQLSIDQIIHSSGTIDPYETIRVGFENNSDFLTPESGPYVWASQQSNWSMRDPATYGLYFNQTTEQVHSGTYAAKLELTNPVDENSFRIHIYHEWGDLVNDTEIWTEAWYYFPTDFVLNQWVQFHTALSEKYFTLNGPVMNVAEGIGIADTPFYKINSTTYKPGMTINPDSNFVDENHDGVNDVLSWTGKNNMSPSDQSSYWVRSAVPITFGTWFCVTSHVHRSLSQTQGLVEVWINNQLAFNITERTMAWDPMKVDDPYWGGDGHTLVRDLPRTGGLQRYLFNSGISLYSGDLSASPKHIYVDDVVLKHLRPGLSTHQTLSAQLSKPLQTSPMETLGFNPGDTILSTLFQLLILLPTKSKPSAR
jgi:hypothetical protein